MIDQAYIFGALGRAALKQDGKWYLIDADDKHSFQPWHPFDQNDLVLTEPETIAIQPGKSLDDIRKLLTSETRKQEALTLALQLMDSRIKDGELKIEIAKLLGKYSSRKAVFEFVENRLLTSPLGKTFSPQEAKEVCMALGLTKFIPIYELLATKADAIHVFHTAWLKIGKRFFENPEKLDKAFSLLTDEGVAKGLVLGIMEQREKYWNDAKEVGERLLGRYGLLPADSGALDDMRLDIEENFMLKLKSEIIDTEDTSIARTTLIDNPYTSLTQEIIAEEKHKESKSNLIELDILHGHDEAKTVLVGGIYMKMSAYCYTIAVRLGVPYFEIEDKFHSFIHDKLLVANIQVLRKMANSVTYTGSCFRNYLIDLHRKKKNAQIVDISEALHLTSDQQADFAYNSEQKHYEDVILHTFKNGDLYVKVFRMSLDGYDNNEINKSLGIHSSHIIKHRIQSSMSNYFLTNIKLGMGEKVKNLPEIPSHPKTNEDLLLLNLHITKLMQQEDWGKAEQLTMKGFEYVKNPKNMTILNRQLSFIRIQTNRFEEVVRDNKNNFKFHPIDNLFLTHAQAACGYYEPAKKSLEKIQLFKELPIVYEAGTLISQKYKIGYMKKESLTPFQLDKAIFKAEFQALTTIT